MNTPAFSITSLTIAAAMKIGVQAFRDGKTFAKANVRPDGFSLACIRAGRMDLIEAVDQGWHTANLAEPVKLPDRTVMGNSAAAARLEQICNA